VLLLGGVARAEKEGARRQRGLCVLVVVTFVVVVVVVVVVA